MLDSRPGRGGSAEAAARGLRPPCSKGMASIEAPGSALASIDQEER